MFIFNFTQLEDNYEMYQPISSRNLPVYLINKLENDGFYYSEDIKTTQDINNPKGAIPDISEAMKAPKPKNTLEILQEESDFHPIKTFIPELGSFLKNKIIVGSITELCGLPGSGKTQICLHLAVGANGDAVFIHTNKNLNPQRLTEIAKKFKVNEAMMEQILCIEATDPVELMASIHFLESWLLDHKNIRLLIIDCITWPLKQQATTERSNFICVLLQSLRSLANLYNFPIVVTNNLTTGVSEGKTHYTSSFGDTFYHLINNRILLSKEENIFRATILKSASGYKNHLCSSRIFMEDKEVSEEFIKNEAKVEVDAIHPRFMEPQDAEVIRQYEIQNHYYCDECRLFFAPTVLGLKTHFRGDMVQHKPYASCFYCQGNVYQYKINNERKFYHNCRDYKKDDEEKSD